MEKLTADQFARLTELLVKGSKLTAEEKTEKSAFEAIIVAEDETPPADGEEEGAGATAPPADDDAGEGDPIADDAASDTDLASSEAEHTADDPASERSGAKRPPMRPTPSRKGRPSVPSWDDIVFGTMGSGQG